MVRVGNNSVTNMLFKYNAGRYLGLLKLVSESAEYPCSVRTEIKVWACS